MDIDEWKEELPQITECSEASGYTLPAVLWAELDALGARLGARGGTARTSRSSTHLLRRRL